MRVDGIAGIDKFVSCDCVEDFMVKDGSLDEDVVVSVLVDDRNAAHLDQGRFFPQFDCQIILAKHLEIFDWNM